MSILPETCAIDAPCHDEVATLRAEVQRLTAALENAANRLRKTANYLPLPPKEGATSGWLKNIAAECQQAHDNAKAVLGGRKFTDWKSRATSAESERDTLRAERDAAQQLAQAYADMLKETQDRHDAACAESVAMRSALDEIHRLVFRSESEPGDYKTYLRYSGELTAAWKRIAELLATPSPSAEWLAKRDEATRADERAKTIAVMRDDAGRARVDGERSGLVRAAEWLDSQDTYSCDCHTEKCRALRGASWFAAELRCLAAGVGRTR